VEDRCTGSANVPQAKKLFSMHPMEFLDDEAQVEARFGLFGDSANLDARYVIGLRRTYHRVRNHFRCNQWYSKVMRLMQKLISVYLETVLILTQDTYTVCTEHTIGSEIVLDAPDETPR
jgi:galactitol-specific phosphotransferase system IIC component